MDDSGDIAVRDVPAQTIAYREGKGSYLHAEELIGRVRSWAVTMGYSREGPLSIVFLDDPDPSPEGPCRYEVWAPVTDRARTTPDDPVQVREEPATRAAVRTIAGASDPMQIEPLYAEMNAWLAAHGHQKAGPARWVYETDPARLSVGEELVTQFIFPVAGRETAGG